MSSGTDVSSLTAGKRLVRNTFWNLLGDGAPLLVALVAIPQLVHAMGTQRFGILTLVWMLIGYLGLFDLGLGRALTNLVAQKLGAGEENSLPPLVWTANILMFALGIVAGVILAGVSHWLVYSALKIPDELRREALASLYMISGVLPAVISTTGFRGLLQGYQRFDIVNAIRIPMGVFAFAAPLAVLPFSHRLPAVVAVLTAGRFIAWLVHIGASVAVLPSMRSAMQWQSQVVRPLLSFGGWVTVTNLVGPIMAGLDRFLIGAMVSVQAVAFYATSYEIITKLLLVPIALAGVLFPAFSTKLIADPAGSGKLYSRAWKAVLGVMAPLVFLCIVAARPGLKIWLGADFADHSTVVLQVLAVGVFFNSVVYLLFALVQGGGRADWTGKMHVAEMPVYLLMFWVLTTHFGIVGTALAWSLRVVIELCVLLLLARKLLRARLREAASGTEITVGVTTTT